MKKIDEFWAKFFGLGVEEFLQPQRKVVPHAGLHGYQGAWLFQRDLSVILSVPAEWVEEIRAAIERAPDFITDADFIALFGNRVEKVIGPAYQGYLDEANFRPAISSARLLSSYDNPALLELRAACDAIEWEHSDIAVDHQPNFGCFEEGRLVAVSNYRMEAPRAAMPGVITHPHYRRRGYGKAVLSAAAAHGLGNGFLMLYQTLIANQPAIAAAQSLGYQQYATHLAVRLKL
jgi:GNAT superfamily N-acetyltransferase